MKIKRILPILFAFCLFLTACGSAKPEDTVSKFLDAAKSSDVETMSKYVVDGKKNFEEVESAKEEDYIDNYIKSANSKITYDVENSEIKDDTATVTVKCKFVDSSDFIKEVMGEYFTKAMGQAFTSGDEVDADKILKDIFTEKLKDNEDKLIEKTIKVNCVKSDDAWLIKDVSDDLANVLTANILSVEKEMNESFNQDNDSEENTPEDKLLDIQNWVVGDIWNDGFCEISSYVADGTSCTGEKLDIDFTIEQLKKSMKSKSEYNKFINGLDDKKYDDIKSVWSKLSPEIDKLYNKLTTKKPVAKDSSYDFDTGYFEQYQEAFDDAIDKLS